MYVAELYGGLGVLTLVKRVLSLHNLSKKIEFTLKSDCQSAIHKFKSNYRVISMDSKLSYIVQEIIDIKRNYIAQLMAIKIAAHQDNIKRFSKLSFFERLNVRCDVEAKQLISNAITANYTPSLPFQFNSPMILNKVKLLLITTEIIRDEIYL